MILSQFDHTLHSHRVRNRHFLGGLSVKILKIFVNVSFKARLIKERSHFRIPGHSFTCHWIRLMSIVLCLDLPSLPTNVSDRVFCSLDEGKKSCNEKHREFENFNLLKYKARTREPPQEARFKRLTMANICFYMSISYTPFWVRAYYLP